MSRTKPGLLGLGAQHRHRRSHPSPRPDHSPTHSARGTRPEITVRCFDTAGSPMSRTERNSQSNLSAKTTVGEGRMKFGPLQLSLPHFFPRRCHFGFPSRSRVTQWTHTVLEQSRSSGWPDNANVGCRFYMYKLKHMQYNGCNNTVYPHVYQTLWLYPTYPSDKVPTETFL